MREVETRSLAATTTPQWRQTFHMPIEDVSHVLRVIALHDAQKGVLPFKGMRHVLHVTVLHDSQKGGTPPKDESHMPCVIAVHDAQKHNPPSLQHAAACRLGITAPLRVQLVVIWGFGFGQGVWHSCCGPCTQQPCWRPVILRHHQTGPCVPRRMPIRGQGLR